MATSKSGTRREPRRNLLVVSPTRTRAPKYATRSKKVKTDKRDARTLCEACRIGAYHPSHRTSDKQRCVRVQLAMRAALMQTRAKYMSLIGALARREGVPDPDRIS